jgi:hypothetical protein
MEKIFLLWEICESYRYSSNKQLIGVYKEKEIIKEQIEIWKNNYPNKLQIEEMVVIETPIKPPFGLDNV